MITIISGTNRNNSRTRLVANHYKEVFEKLTDEPVELLALEEVPFDILNADMYTTSGQADSLRAIQDKYLIPANKYFIISPEYNGSFSGYLKLFIDATSIREYKSTFSGKKAGLAGIASGRSGNLRGMDHLTAVMHHVGTDVMPFKLPISQIETLLKDDEIVNEGILNDIEQQVKAFLVY